MTLMPMCDILDVCDEGNGAHSVSVTYSCYGMGSGPGGGGRSIVGSGFPWDAEDMHIFLVVECVGCSHTHDEGTGCGDGHGDGYGHGYGHGDGSGSGYVEQINAN